MNKLKKELKEFRKFKNEYKFEQLELKYEEDNIYYGDILVSDGETTLSEHEDFINVGYKLKGATPKLLSNLYPYEFKFKGKKVSSIEGVFQGIKFKDKKEQTLVLRYSRLDANNIKGSNLLDWKKEGKLYWQGKEIDRFKEEYQRFLEELYISAIQNPLYRNVLINTNKYILHSMGVINKEDTVFTRYEFEEMLNCLSAFLKRKK